MSVASETREQLVKAGLSPQEASRKASLLTDAARALEMLGANAPDEARHYFVPGRIEVLGKHTDYAGGRSLLAAAERGFCVAASPCPDNRLRIVDAVDGSRADMVLDPDLSADAAGWAIYPTTVARRLARNFPAARRGADIAFASDLPRAAGLSSSSALVVALFVAVGDINGLSGHREFASVIAGRERLAEYLGCLENGLTFDCLEGDRGVGALTGGEDQLAILCCRPGELLQSTFCPIQPERSIAWRQDWTFVVASSGVSSDKTGSVRDRYNRLSLAARAALDCWWSATGRQDATLFAAAMSAPDAPGLMREILRRSSHADFSARELEDRFDQFFFESVEILPAAADALTRGDVETFGRIVDRSQQLAQELLQNQIGETVELARAARAMGAAAASAFGGGFGGSVWALVPADESSAFRQRWTEAYARAFPATAREAAFFETRPGPSLCRLDRKRGAGSISDLI